MCDQCSDPECDVTPDGKPLPFILGETHRAITREPYSDEVIVTITSVLGSPTGQFIAHRDTLPQLAEINASPEGANYFHWQD